jgi:hypothetical protein
MSHSLPRLLLQLVAYVSRRKYQQVYALSGQIHDASQDFGTPEDLKILVNGLLQRFLGT